MTAVLNVFFLYSILYHGSAPFKTVIQTTVLKGERL